MEETTYFNGSESRYTKDAMSIEDFAKLNEAIQQKKNLLIKYFNRALNKVEDIMIDPYGILYNVPIFSGGWYVLAFCHRAKRIKVFNFNRIKEITLLPNSLFELPQNFSVKKYVCEVLDEAEKLYEKGNKLVDKNEDDKAVQFFKKAISLYPAYGDAYLSLAGSYRMLGDDEGAVEEFKNALENECTDPDDVYFQLSDCLSSMGKEDEAAKVCKTAIKISPKSPSRQASLHKQLGDRYYEQGKYDRAIKEYEKAIEIDPEPEYKDVFKNLINCYGKIGNKEKVGEWLEKMSMAGITPPLVAGITPPPPAGIMPPPMAAMTPHTHLALTY